MYKCSVFVVLCLGYELLKPRRRVGGDERSMGGGRDSFEGVESDLNAATSRGFTRQFGDFVVVVVRNSRSFKR
jgi:hypothetical protein